MPRDDSLTPPRTRPEDTRARTALIGLGALAVLGLGYWVYGQVTVSPGTAQRIVISRGGEVTRVVGPGQTGYINPFLDGRMVFDMAVLATDRSTPDRGMAGVSADGHPFTLFGAAIWHEGSEEDLRWRFAHIKAGAEMMSPLMASSVQAILGTRSMDDIIRDAGSVQAALTADLKDRAKRLLRIELQEFVLTRIEPGESFRAVVAEREVGRARAAAIAASPAVAANNENAIDIEMIRRWDGRGIIPETLERRDRRPAEPGAPTR